MVYMYHSFLIHSSAEGHLGCFHVLAMINSAAMNIGVHVSLSDLASLITCTLNKEREYVRLLYITDTLPSTSYKSLSLSISLPLSLNIVS